MCQHFIYKNGNFCKWLLTVVSINIRVFLIMMLCIVIHSRMFGLTSVLAFNHSPSVHMYIRNFLGLRRGLQCSVDFILAI